MHGSVQVANAKGRLLKSLEITGVNPCICDFRDASFGQRIVLQEWFRALSNGLLVEVPGICSHSCNDACHIATWFARIPAGVHSQDIQHVPEVQPDCSDHQQHLQVVTGYSMTYK